MVKRKIKIFRKSFKRSVALEVIHDILHGDFFSREFERNVQLLQEMDDAEEIVPFKLEAFEGDKTVSRESNIEDRFMRESMDMRSYEHMINDSTGIHHFVKTDSL